MKTLMKSKSGFLLIVPLLLVVFSGGVAFGDLDLGTLVPLNDSVPVQSSRVGYDRRTGQFSATVTTTNISAEAIPSPVYLVIESITSPAVTVANADGLTVDGKPYFVLLSNGELASGGAISVRIAFSNPQRRRFNFVAKAYCQGTGEEAMQGQAVLGPLSGASVNVYLLADLNNSIYTAETDENGYFGQSLGSLVDGTCLMVTVKGGQDTDANDDGIPDSSPTTNKGTIHALLSVSEFNAGFKVSALTDIAWQLTKALIGEVNHEAINIRLDDLAKILIVGDINGDGVISSTDLVSFDPLDVSHRSKLAFNYEDLFATDQDGNSVISAYHNNDEATLIELLQNRFGTYMTFFPSSDLRNPKVKVQVSLFGRGSVTSDIGNIDLSSERDEEFNTTHDFFEKDATATVTLTATPIPGTEILGWTGCDEVASDKTQAKVSLGSNREITVSFGYEEAHVNPNLVDLSRTQVERYGSTLNVLVDSGDEEIISAMAGLSEGHYVVGPTDGGFLLRVLTVDKITELRYTLTGEPASLEDVIQQGTGTMTKWLTHGDLADSFSYTSEDAVASSVERDDPKEISSIPATPATSTIASILATLPEPGVSFSAIEGVRLLPSAHPDDRVFTIQIGNPSGAALQGPTELRPSDDRVWEDKVTLYDKGGVKVEASGYVDLEILIDAGVSFGWTGLESFKLIPTVKSTQHIQVTVTGEVDCEPAPISLGAIPFGSLMFLVGLVPVWVDFVVEVSVGGEIHVKAQITTGATFRQSLTAGVNYNNVSGFDWPHSFTKSWEFAKPHLEAELEAIVYVKATPKISIYSLTGPAVDIKPYLRLSGELDDTLMDLCESEVSFSAWFGLESNLFWDFPDDNPLGDFLHLDELEEASTVSIVHKEWNLARWDYGGECELPPYLEVVGPHLSETVGYESGEVITQHYVLTNVGGRNLDWSISRSHSDDIISIGETTGTLAADEATTVTVSVDTSTLSIGDYRDVLFFNNDSVPSEDSAIYGSTLRNVDIKVIPSELPTPHLLEPSLFSPSIVELNWQCDDSDYVDGYYLFQSTDGTTWEHIVTLTDPDESRYLVSSLWTDESYYFIMVAYSNDKLQSDFSNVVSIELTGHRPAHFSGLLMCDHFAPPWLTETYVEDMYSEYVGPGMYPLNSAAFPKATRYTFDGIAISAGTRVTIYSQPNFLGEILYQKVGPAIVNNRIWKSYSRAAPVMWDWKEPLQSMFPQSVREWSDTNMHQWPSGSMIIEYIGSSD